MFYKGKIKTATANLYYLFFYKNIKLVHFDFQYIEKDHKRLNINVLFVIQCNENTGLEAFANYGV